MVVVVVVVVVVVWGSSGRSRFTEPKAGSRVPFRALGVRAVAGGRAPSLRAVAGAGTLGPRAVADSSGNGTIRMFLTTISTPEVCAPAPCHGKGEGLLPITELWCTSESSGLSYLRGCPTQSCKRKAETLAEGIGA